LPQYVDAGPTAPVGACLGSVTIERICFKFRTGGHLAGGRVREIRRVR
jgi:hypothetical protein